MAQYMLLLHQLPDTNAALPPAVMTDVVRRYYAWAETMRQKGKLVGGEKLAVGRVRHIRMRDGTPLSSDGPYAEAKDVIGGYFVIEARDDAEADFSPATARICGTPPTGSRLRPIDLMTAAEAPVQAKAAGCSDRSTNSSTRWRAIWPTAWSPPWRGGWARAASPSPRTPSSTRSCRRCRCGRSRACRPGPKPGWRSSPTTARWTCCATNRAGWRWSRS